MATRRALVHVSGGIRELPAGDDLAGTYRGVSLTISGKPAASQEIRLVAPYAFTLSAAASIWSAKTAFTASSVFNLYQNGSSIGTVTFSAGATLGVLSLTTTAITAGAAIDIVCPSTQDATGATIGVNLMAALT